MKRLIKVLLCLLMIVSLGAYRDVKAEPGEDEITNIHIGGAGGIYWDAVPGAEYYSVRLSRYDEEGNIRGLYWLETDQNALDLYETLLDEGAPAGVYQDPIVYARDAEGRYCAEGKGTGKLNHTTSGKFPGVATNLKWDGLYAVWDMVPNAEFYFVTFYRNGVRWGTEKFYGNAAYGEKYVIGEEFGFTFTVQAGKRGYENGEESDHSPSIKGLPQVFTRVSGPNRYQTSLAIAEKIKEIYGIDKFSTVFVTTGTNYPDALSGSFLANYHRAPILMINENNATMVAAYIAQNIKADGTVYILGGTGAVKDEWLSGFKTKRLSGSSRYGTNLAVLRESGVTGGTFLVCTGEGFADALSCSSLDIPMLLVKKSLNSAQKEYLATLNKDATKFIIIGGTGAVPEEVANELGNYGTVTRRISGKDRYITSRYIGSSFRMGNNIAVLATGKDFPDGLCAGPLAYAMYAPILLVADGKTNQASRYFLRANVTVRYGYISGGEAAVSDEAAADAFGVISVK